MRIRSIDYPLTESIKSKITEFEENLKKHFTPTNEVQLTLSKETPTQFRVDIQAYAFGKAIRSHHLSHNFHKAFKLGSDHFIHSIIKAKRKINSRRREPLERNTA